MSSAPNFRIRDSARSATSVRAEFASRLRSARRDAGYRSARAFAKRLGVDENRYTRYERAEVEPSMALIVSIVVELNVSADWLLGLNEQTTPN